MVINELIMITVYLSIHTSSIHEFGFFICSYPRFLKCIHLFLRVTTMNVFWIHFPQEGFLTYPQSSSGCQGNDHDCV